MVDCTYQLETMVLNNTPSRRKVGEEMLTAVYTILMDCGECIMASLGFPRLIRNSLKRFKRECKKAGSGKVFFFI